MKNLNKLAAFKENELTANEGINADNGYKGGNNGSSTIITCYEPTEGGEDMLVEKWADDGSSEVSSFTYRHIKYQ